jgi:glycosyltransferase involved in cell wall biosynthesis
MTYAGPHVVVDARMARDGGIGTYLQALVPRLAQLRPEWRFTTLGDARVMRALDWDRLPNVRLTHCRARIFSLREQVELPLRWGRATDLFWAPNYNVPMVMPPSLVVTIHDVNHLALPELLGGTLRRAYARRLLTSAVRRAREVLFDSEFTRRETERVLGTPCGHGTVVHAAVESDWSNARAQSPQRPITDPYFLYVGNIKRHKNVPLLMRAFHRIKDAIAHRLVLIGRTDGLRADPEVAAVLPLLGDRAMVLGEVPGQQLRQYVAHADALVTASLYEGFGLPPLEAMAAGCPCVVSSAGSLPEICGDAALYCDPHDESSVATALRRVAHSPALRSELVERGRARAAQFSWERSAAMTVDVMERALSRR